MPCQATTDAELRGRIREGFPRETQASGAGGGCVAACSKPGFVEAPSGWHGPRLPVCGNRARLPDCGSGTLRRPSPCIQGGQPPPCPADGTGTAEASSGLVRSPSQYTPRKRPTRPSLAWDTPPPGTAKRPRLALSVVGTYRPADTSDVCERLVWNRVYRESACNHS